MRTIRLTTSQALIRYLCNQYVEIDGETVRFFAGMWAIFGHGNVAGIGEALYGARDMLPTYRAHNEQAMAHAAIGFAKASRRRRVMACTTSIGPGALNMVTAAGVAHVNRLPDPCFCPAMCLRAAAPIRFSSRSKIFRGRNDQRKRLLQAGVTLFRPYRTS